jgi:dTDP-4-amino-4,6-dideoxygalactose transaminase
MTSNLKHRIYLSPPHMGCKEMNYVNEAFKTNWIAPLGPNVNSFEKELATYTSANYAAALSSGTAAIHLALLLLDVQPGDYVICQSFTFSATANPIRYLGAVPVFVDSESDTWNMCPQLLEQAIQACMEGKFEFCGSKNMNLKPAKPKAIIPVDLYGMPARLDKILNLAEKYDIPVIEDAAEALGSELYGKKCGTFGLFGVLSFNGNKIITTSGGGALISDNEELIERARFLATQARDPAPHYQHSQIGYNYRMSNVLAGIGRGQLMVINDRVLQRRSNYNFYFELFKDKNGISLLQEPDGFYSNRWLTVILVNPEKTGGVTRETIRLTLENDNIESRPLWKPMHLQPIFSDTIFFTNGISEMLFKVGLCLPSGSNMTEEDKKRIADTINNLL